MKRTLKKLKLLDTDAMQNDIIARNKLKMILGGGYGYGYGYGGGTICVGY